MTTNEFWLLMEASYAMSSGNTDERVRLLVKDLAALGPKAVLTFEHHLDHFVGQACDRSYSPGSAFHSAEGFSDDSLRDFMYAIVAAGEEIYYKIPGASCHCEIESVRDELDSGESIWLVPMYAYYRATGLPHPQFGESDYEENSIYLLVEDAPANPICDEVAA